MKVLALLFSFLICYASAEFYDALDNGCDEMVSDFWSGMNMAPSLAEVLPDFAEEVQQVETDVKSQLAKALREVLTSAAGRLKELLQQAQEARQLLLEKAAIIVGKLKSLSGSELAERLRENVRDWISALLKKMDLVSGQSSYELVRVPLEFNDRSLMENVGDRILEKLNLNEIVDYVKNKLPKLGEFGRTALATLLRPGALNSLKDFLRALLQNSNPEYGISDLWNKVKDFFKGLGVKISDKFFLFANWIKNVSKSGWENIKDKSSKLKEIAKTVIEKSTTMSKNVASQALEFFQEHKEEIGEALFKILKVALVKVITKGVV